MKHNNHYRRMNTHACYPGPMYPNAADANYFTNKALNTLTVIVSSMGFVTAMIFLVNLA